MNDHELRRAIAEFTSTARVLHMKAGKVLKREPAYAKYANMRKFMQTLRQMECDYEGPSMSRGVLLRELETESRGMRMDLIEHDKDTAQVMRIQVIMEDAHRQVRALLRDSRTPATLTCPEERVALETDSLPLP